MVRQEVRQEITGGNRLVELDQAAGSIFPLKEGGRRDTRPCLACSRKAL